MQPEILIFKSTEEIAEEIAVIFNRFKQSLTGEKIHIALSGGSTPKAIFEHLTNRYGSAIVNESFHFWWGDERCVAPNDDESNYKWAKQLFLSPVGIPEENIHRIHGEDNPEDEAVRYSEEIVKHVPFVNGSPKFDFMLLGMGEDGHTASIFPNQLHLFSSKKLCEVATHPESGQKRITITGRVINSAKIVSVLTTGKQKAEMLNQVVKLKNDKLPAAHINPVNGHLFWYTDEAAAQKL